MQESAVFDVRGFRPPHASDASHACRGATRATHFARCSRSGLVESSRRKVSMTLEELVCLQSCSRTPSYPEAILIDSDTVVNKRWPRCQLRSNCLDCDAFRRLPCEAMTRSEELISRPFKLWPHLARTKGSRSRAWKLQAVLVSIVIEIFLVNMQQTQTLRAPSGRRGMLAITDTRLKVREIPWLDLIL
jgi:hypothetical protein